MEKSSHPSSNRIKKPEPATAAACAVLLLLLCGSALALALSARNSASAAPQIARIYLGGELLQEIDLSKVTESYRITVEGSDGARNVLQVEPGNLYVCEANCPDRICMHPSLKSHTNLPIICLPHHLVITRSGVAADAPDAITW